MKALKTKKKSYPENAPGVPAKFGGSEPNQAAQDSGPHLPIPQAPPLKQDDRQRLIDLEHHIHGLDASLSVLRGDVKRLRVDFSEVLRNMIASAMWKSESGPATLFNISSRHKGLDT